MLRKLAAIALGAAALLTVVFSANAAIVATTPYQLRAQGTCADGTCTLNYPIVATNRRLDIDFVSCAFVTTKIGAELSVASIGIDDASSPTTTTQVLLWNIRTAFGDTIGEISQPVPLTITATHRPQIKFAYLLPTGPGFASTTARCTIAGDMHFLQ
jgi:hypothetical protein